MARSMQQLVLGVAWRLGVGVTLGVKLGRVIVIGQHVERLTVVIEFVCKPLRVETVGAETHQK